MSPDYVRPHRLDVLLDMPSASHDMQQKHAWNADDRSLNVFVKVGLKTSSRRRVDGLWLGLSRLEGWKLGCVKCGLFVVWREELVWIDRFRHRTVFKSLRRDR